MRGIFTLAFLDILLWRRMPLAILCALIPPIGMTLLLIILSLTVTQQPVALVVNGSGPATDKIQKIISSDADAYLLIQTNAATAQKLLKNQEIAAIITIPKDFDANVKNHTATVNLLLNNIDIDFADDIRRSINRSVAQFDAPQLSLQGQHSENTATLTNPYLININEHDLRETNVPWLNYQIIPAIILLILNVGLIGTALLCAFDKERKTARYLAITPQAGWILVAGRILGGFLVSMLALIPAVILCLLTGVIAPPLQHWPALIVIFMATAICASGLGAVLGTIFQGSKTIAMASSIITTYLFFLGGGFTTIAFLPSWIQTLSAFIPTRYAIDGLRQALFYSTLDQVPLDLFVLLFTAFFAIILGAISVRRCLK